MFQYLDYVLADMVRLPCLTGHLFHGVGSGESFYGLYEYAPAIASCPDAGVQRSLPFHDWD